LPSHLDAAANTLESFSVLLICEWLPASAPLLARHLGWAITDFTLFHEKENTVHKDLSLMQAAFGDEWRAALTVLNSLDVKLFDAAQKLAADQLRRFGIKPPPRVDTKGAGAET
jgi:hypothetical protein